MFLDEAIISTINVNGHEVVSPVKEDSIVKSVIEKFKERSNVGIKKYNTTLDREDLSTLQWIHHAQEELMDGILYLEKLKKNYEEHTITATENTKDNVI